MSYDPKCEELARHFLEGEDGYSPQDEGNFAQWIQDQSELWLHRRVVANDMMDGI